MSTPAGRTVADVSGERCACPQPVHPTEDGRCAEEPLRAGGDCACCIADCPDVHSEPVGMNFVPGSARIAAEYVATLSSEEQAEIRAKEAVGELRIVPQAEMRIGDDA